MIKKTLLNFIEKILPSSFYIQHLPDLHKQLTPDIRKESKSYNSGCDRLTRDGVRVLMVKYLLDLVISLPSGDYAELGTYQGNFARLIFKDLAPEAELYCFDTYEGFLEEDINIENRVTELKIKKGRFSNTSPELVRKNILGESDDHRRLKLVKGHFPESFKGYEDKFWRFVHLDADLYEPIKSGVSVFWPKIVRGGVLLVHDYNGGYAGTRKAIDEFFTPLGLKPIPMPDKSGSALIIKN